MKRGKKYEAAMERFDRQHLYGVGEAVDLVKELAHASFDETVELAVRLGVDPRKADQIVRGTLSLPHGTGRNGARGGLRCGGRGRRGAPGWCRRGRGRRSGGQGRRRIRRLRRRDRHSRPDGPGRQARPDPRPAWADAEPEDRHCHDTTSARTVAEFKAGRVEYRTDKVGNVHVPVGKVSFSRQDLIENVHAVVEELSRAKPASSKGRYLRAVTLSSTMGPGVHIDPAEGADETCEDDLAANGASRFGRRRNRHVKAARRVARNRDTQTQTVRRRPPVAPPCGV